MKSLITAVTVTLAFLSNGAFAEDCYFVPAWGNMLVGKTLKVSADIPCYNDDSLKKEIVYVRHKSGDKKIAVGLIISKESCRWGMGNTFAFEYDIERDLDKTLNFFEGYQLTPLSYEEYSSYNFFPKCEVPPPVPSDRVITGD